MREILDLTRAIDRRTFLADLGRGAFAVAIVGLAGCAPAAQSTLRPSATAGAASSSPTSSPAPSAEASGSAPGGDAEPVTWERINLGFVSAYVLVRGGEAAVVDTGVAGSAPAIEDSLAAIGLDWSAVGHLILTHRHADHAGSAADVLELAPDAAAYAGADEIPAITVPRALTPVGDGDRVFDLDIVATPGHTAGSICVLDPIGGILVAGDALRTDGGRPALPGAEFTDDMTQAIASIGRLGELTFETLLVGHGEPIERGASRVVAELAAQQ